MLTQDTIDPALSKGASLVVLAPYKHWKLRFCVNHRRLTAMPVWDTHSVPAVDRWLDSLRDSITFFTIDCNSGQWQDDVHKPDHNRNIFSSLMGSWNILECLSGCRVCRHRFNELWALFHQSGGTICAALPWWYYSLLEDLHGSSKTCPHSASATLTLRTHTEVVNVTFLWTHGVVSETFRPTRAASVNGKNCKAIQKSLSPTSHT